MTHLIKSTTVVMQGGASVIRMACVNNPHIKGSMVNAEKFATIPVEKRCKKCQAIFEKQQAKVATLSNPIRGKVMFKGQLIDCISFGSINQ
jgi:DUF917 family protein